MILLDTQCKTRILQWNKYLTGNQLEQYSGMDTLLQQDKQYNCHLLLSCRSHLHNSTKHQHFDRILFQQGIGCIETFQQDYNIRNCSLQETEKDQDMTDQLDNLSML